jgi:hypothetical protein
MLNLCRPAHDNESLYRFAGVLAPLRRRCTFAFVTDDGAVGRATHLIAFDVL